MQILTQTPTPNLNSSIDFYSKLGFRQISKNALIFTDGKANIEINPERYARAGFKMFKHTWQEEIHLLNGLTKVISTKEGFLFSDPSGVWIYLIETESIPAFAIEDISFGILGNYMGISLESTYAEKSFEIYQILGFKLTFETTDSGFFAMNAHDFTISIMKPNSCPHLFFNPSLTYFNGKNNQDIIAKIRFLEIPITEEITFFNKEGVVDNIIIRDPGGLGFFVFND